MRKLSQKLIDLYNQKRHFFIERVMVVSQFKEESLTYWRMNILFTVLLTSAIFFTLVLLSAPFLIFQLHRWGLLVLDLMAYAMTFFLLVSRHLNYRQRASITLILCYTLGVGVLGYLGPLSGGPMWLFTFAVLAGLLLGIEAGIVAVAINAITLVIWGSLYNLMAVGPTFPQFSSITAMYVAGLTFIVLNLVASLSVSVLVKGLIRSHSKQIELSESLAQEREQLLLAKEKLENEVKERRSAEEALRENEEKYRFLADNVMDVIWTMDMNLRFTYYSPSVERLTGYSTEEALQISLQEIAAPHSYNELLTIFGQELEKIKRYARSSQEYISVHTELRRKDQSLVSVEALCNFIYDQNGRPEGIIGITRDITERKKAEAALQESESKFRGIAENSFDVILLTDATGVIIYVSPSCTPLFQYQPVEIEGRHFNEFVAKEDLPMVIERFAEKMRGTDQGILEMRVRRKDGRQAYVELNASIVIKDGEAVGIQGIMRDVTQRKEMEARLLHAQKMESMGTLAGGIAHDFNNILGIIIGNTELALDDLTPSDPAKEFVDEIRIAALRAKDIVRQILSVARKTPADRKPVRIAEAVREALKLMRATTPATIAVHAAIACETEEIFGNVTEIHQILINLFNNAVDAMVGEAGELRVQLNTIHINKGETASYANLPPGDFVRLSVEDTGSGIDPEIIGRIFDPYFTTKDVDKGTGMGLAVVYGIVQKHEGIVLAHSRPGKGTTIEVLLPTYSGGQINESPKSLSPQKAGAHILFVDDEQHLIKSAKQMLERQGYTVTTATSGLEALNLFAQNPAQFDLVITDMAMPRMAGDRLAQTMMDIQPNIPIIVCTGHSTRLDEAKAAGMGIKAFILKPFEKEELTMTVDKVLGKPQMEND